MCIRDSSGGAPTAAELARYGEVVSADAVQATMQAKADQVASMGARLSAERRSMIDAEIEREIADAIQFAEDSPFPESKALYTNVYAGH